MSEHDPRHAAERAGRGALEAILMVVDEPVSDVVLATALELTVNEVRATLVRLAADYDENGRGFPLRQVAGGWRFYSRPEFADVVERFLMDGQRARLSQAALETLATISFGTVSLIEQEPGQPWDVLDTATLS